jgi:hypothetical protein
VVEWHLEDEAAAHPQPIKTRASSRVGRDPSSGRFVA